jgi:hypothetical protein
MTTTLRRTLAAATTLALSACVALAEDAVDLRAELVPGEGASWRFHQDLSLEAQMGAVDQVNIEALTFTQRFDTHVLEVEEDGTATVELVFEHIEAKYRREDPGFSIRDAFDSAAPEAAGAGHLKRAIEPMIGTKLRVRVRPSGEIFFVGGLEGRAPTMDRAAATIFDRMFDAEALERGLGPMFRLKEHPSQEWPAEADLRVSQAREGETWLTERREASRAGEMWTHFTHTLRKVEDGVASISTGGRVLIRNAGLTPVSPEFNTNEVKGVATWDVEDNALLEHTLNWRIELQMGGDEMPIIANIVDVSHLQRIED